MYRLLLAALAVALVLSARRRVGQDHRDRRRPAHPRRRAALTQPVRGDLAHDRVPDADRHGDATCSSRRADGRIVAWTITLGTPGKKQQKFFNGEPRRRRRRRASPCSSPAIATSAACSRRRRSQTLTPYFGQTVQFPLETSLAVTKGSIIALSVPTWAPALALGLARDNVVAREPRRRRLRRHADPERADRHQRPGPLQVLLPDRADRLQRDADHDAGAPEGAEPKPQTPSVD